VIGGGESSCLHLKNIATDETVGDATQENIHLSPTCKKDGRSLNE